MLGEVSLICFVIWFGFVDETCGLTGKNKSSNQDRQRQLKQYVIHLERRQP